MNFNAVRREMEKLLKIVPQGVVIEYSITDNQIKFLIKEKPTDFTRQQADELIDQLNAVVKTVITINK